MRKIFFLFIFWLGSLACTSDLGYLPENKVDSNNTALTKESNFPTGKLTPGQEKYQKALKISQTKFREREIRRSQNPVVIPPEYKKFDFRNFTFPETFDKFDIKLKDGKYEFQNPTECDFRSYSLQDFDFYDFTGDGEMEAFINVSNHQGCVSSGVSELFYIYTVSNNKLKLHWKFQTGSQAFCGLTDFEIKDSKLMIEAIGECVYNGRFLENKSYFNDISAHSLTRLTFGWNGNKFVQEKSEFVPIS